MKKLLIETIPFSVRPELIKESMSRNNGRLIVSGVLQRAGAQNQNGRIYPKPILEREVSRYMETEISQKRALGELDHPDSTVVNLRNVSHNVLSCEWDGDDLVGTIEILSTPAGNILKELFKHEVTLGISSRGMGSVKPLQEFGGGMHDRDEGPDVVEVQDDFELICFDFVSNPSTHGAFMQPVAEGILKESHVRGISNNKYDRAEGLIREIICELSGVCCL